MLDTLQKETCGTDDITLAASLEPLIHPENVANLSLLHLSR